MLVLSNIICKQSIHWMNVRIRKRREQNKNMKYYLQTLSLFLLFYLSLKFQLESCKSSRAPFLLLYALHFDIQPISTLYNWRLSACAIHSGQRVCSLFYVFLIAKNSINNTFIYTGTFDSHSLELNWIEYLNWTLTLFLREQKHNKNKKVRWDESICN